MRRPVITVAREKVLGGFMIVTKKGQTLADVIKTAIEDSVITMAEYEEINSIASEDGILDNHEKALLRELNDMIANKTITFGKSP